VDYFDVPAAAVNENHEEQGQIFGHPDELVTLLPFTLDEVVFTRHVIRIVEDFLRCLERDSMDPLIPFGLCRVPCESRFRITLLYMEIAGT